MAVMNDLYALLDQLVSAVRSIPKRDIDPAASEIEWLIEEDPNGCRDIILKYSRDPEIQLWALGLVANDADLDRFVEALADPKLRKAALGAMVFQQDVARVVQAARGLLTDPDPETRSLAIDLVASGVQPGALNALVRCIDDPEPMVRMNVCFRLGQLGDPKATQDLKRMMDDPHPGVRKAALQSIAPLQ